MTDWGVDAVLTAHDHSYQRWTTLDRNLNPDPAGVTQFVTRTGSVLDSGTVQCSTATPDTSPPTPPSPLSAAAVSSTRVDLSWAASNDNSGVVGYTLYRDGAALANVGGATLGYSDTSVNPTAVVRESANRPELIVDFTTS